MMFLGAIAIFSTSTIKPLYTPKNLMLNLIYFLLFKQMMFLKFNSKDPHYMFFHMGLLLVNFEKNSCFIDNLIIYYLNFFISPKYINASKEIWPSFWNN
jgi:hypothetical protein